MDTFVMSAGGTVVSSSAEISASPCRSENLSISTRAAGPSPQKRACFHRISTQKRFVNSHQMGISKCLWDSGLELFQTSQESTTNSLERNLS